MTAITPDIESPTLTDRLEIIELTSKLGLLVDARDWPAVESLSTDPVAVDYTSLNGGEPQTTIAAELASGWRRVLDRLDATQQLIAGQVIACDGDRASCAANVQGTHVLANATGGPIWTVSGRYDFGLIRTPRRVADQCARPYRAVGDGEPARHDAGLRGRRYA
jgi:hypothetical protein